MQVTHSTENLFDDRRQFTLLYLALPNRGDTPPECVELCHIGGIAFDIALKLFAPEFDARFGCARLFASLMTMPKATMYEDCQTVLGQNDIGTTGKIASVKTKSRSRRMQGSAYRELGPGVLLPNSAH